MQNRFEEQVIEIIAQQALLEPQDIGLDTRVETLQLDSLALVECIFALEELFGITIPFNANAPEESDFDFSSVASIVAEVKKLITAQK